MGNPSAMRPGGTVKRSFSAVFFDCKGDIRVLNE
jgi:hypothetical protein